MARQGADAPVVDTDDFADWENPFGWWPELVESVLEPLAAGEAARYQPTSCVAEEHEPVVIDSSRGTVILEGVAATRAVFRPFLAYSIWVEGDQALRLQRGIIAGWSRSIARSRTSI
jgi:hypothetical protein